MGTLTGHVAGATAMAKRATSLNPRGFGGFRGFDPATHETKRRFSIYTCGVSWPGENPQNPETPEG